MARTTHELSNIKNILLSMLLVLGTTTSPLTFAASVALATSPLATSTTSSVKPNLLLVLDNSGSMDWDHMPDDSSDPGSAVTFSFGYYGLRSSQCNQVYFDPTMSYLPPVRADGTRYPDANFASARTNGYSTATCTASTCINLNNAFKASESMSGDSTGQSAYYYAYSGSQTTTLQRNYHVVGNTFYNECHSANGASPGNTVFSKRRFATTETTTIVVSGSTTTSTSVSSITVNGVQLMNAASTTSTSTSTVATNIAAQINAISATSGFSATAIGSTVTITGPTTAANALPLITYSGSMTLTTDVFPDTSATMLTKFANWYSYYRTRMLMMKTATGHAFDSLDSNYRVGLMKISASSTPTVYVNTFWDNADTSLGPVSTHRSTWFTTLYNTTASGSTPLRTALSDAGRYFAGKLSGTDPLQYSCQQNFTLLSTDGYWNSGDGYQINGSTPVGNQDGTAGRPMNDGSTPAGTTVTTTYTRNDWNVTSTKISGGQNCGTGKRRLTITPQTRTCSITTSPSGVVGAETCTQPSNGTTTYESPYTSASSSCGTTADVTASKPIPDPSNWVATGTVTNTISSGGTSDNLADIAMYYYQTDLRTPTLNNCTGTPVPPATTGNIICSTPAVATDDDPYNNVFVGDIDNNTQQHMTTFTLGLGASGWMNYSSSYLSDKVTSTLRDYVDVKLGSTADSSATPPICGWQTNGTVCTWPVPGMTGSDGLIANIDDLWHAAVNGRGAYFSATNPETLAEGLANALESIDTQRGSASAAASSTLNPVSGNNSSYVASYSTVYWKGNLESRSINVDTAKVSENATWCVENVPASTQCKTEPVSQTIGETTIFNCVTHNAVTCAGTMDGTDCLVPVATACTGTMSAKVASGTRVIKTANSTGTALIDFTYANLTATQQSYFGASHINSLNQWASLSTTQQADAVGVNLVNYLRGQTNYDERTENLVTNPDTSTTDNRLFRYRQTTLGDALESQPTFISAPAFNYPYAGYSTFKTNHSTRIGMVYLGANDGMMHAFYANNGAGAATPCVIGGGFTCGGEEAWAYVPSVVIPDMWRLADTSYATKHHNFVNGHPTTSDVCVANCSDSLNAVWKTILVAGLNAGGRGYFALDITNPSAPELLWEFTTTSPGTGKTQDNDLGYTYGKPIITRKNDGTWVVVVTSGYDNGTKSDDPLVNNNPAGSGIGYLYVLNAGSGAIMSKISTGVGTATTPSGLAKIAGWNDEPAGNKVGYIYGGDLLGNLWRFDINSTAAATIGTGSVLKFATLFSDAAGTSPQPITTTPVLGKIAEKRVVFIGTGKYLETGDLTTTQKQTQYAIKDDNATTTFVNPRNTLVQQTLSIDPAVTSARISTGNSVSFYSDRGWFADFPDTGERVNIDGVLKQGILTVATIVPSNTACSPGGYGWLNYFDYKTGAATSLKYDSPIVGISIVYVQGEPQLLVVTSSNPTPEEPSTPPPFPPSAAGFSGKRVIWRELIP